MGFEDREYFRDESENQGANGIPGFQFNRQSIITTLIVINVIIFALDTFSPELTQNDLMSVASAPKDIAPSDPAGQQLTGEHWLSHFLALKADRPWEVWTFLTNGFAHSSLSSKSGVFHILFNMVTLFFLGRPVEEHLGKAEFLKFYLIAIVVGSIGWLIPQYLMGTQNYIVGASGAVSAVVVYFIFLSPNAKLLLFGVVPIPAWGVGVLFLVSNVFHAFAQDHIAWEAHLAGGGFGAMYYYFKWNFASLKMPKGNSNLKVHDPDNDEIDPKLQSEADRILAKISEQGQDSLTSRERKTLERYSAQIRKSRN